MMKNILPLLALCSIITLAVCYAVFRGGFWGFEAKGDLVGENVAIADDFEKQTVGVIANESVPSLKVIVGDDSIKEEHLLAPMSENVKAALAAIKKASVAREALVRRERFVQFMEFTELGEDELDLLFNASARRALLAKKVKSLYDAGTFADAKAVREYYNSEVAKLTEEIKSIAGEEYELFQEETEKIRIRKEVRLLSIILNRKGYPITSEEQARLVDLYWVYMKAANVDFFFGAQYSRVISSKWFTRQMKGRNAAYEFSNAEAAAFLNSEQIRLLEQFQSEQIHGFYFRRTKRYRKTN